MRPNAALPVLAATLAAAPAAAALQEHPERPLPTPEELAELPPDGGPRYNRLVFEQSPYLLQHAANPVDWYPWGDEAFERARREDKPVFLSIGYSTCHWCHVMERESFEDDEVAALLNEHFVSVKVDREERPDVDRIYMSVTQAMTGRGGWPMTVVMTPDRVPFFAGTYFPKRGRFGRQGMMELVPALAAAWEEDRDGILRTADSVTQFLERSNAPRPAGRLGPELLERAERTLAGRYDPTHGGFGPAPKFPVPHNLRLLLRRWARTGEEHVLEMVLHTLERMRMGGIWDHVGFGFHRYSTDERWLLPHFEKMLYDQSLLAITYVEAWQATASEDMRRTAEEILEYVLRDLTSPEGAFHSAEDADSEGEEGIFYLWTPEELESVLGEEDGRLATRVYGVQPEGNFREESTGRPTGRSILHLTRPLRETAVELEMDEGELAARLEGIRERLLEARSRRERPLLDDKVLTDWNGLAIAAFSIAARAFDEPRYERAARRAAEFVLRELRGEDGRLRKRWRNGHSDLPPVLDDYAFLAWGLVELYETGFEAADLRAALEIAGQMVEDFHDEENGGFYVSAPGRDELVVRPVDHFDGAIPSGNAVAALALLRLARLTGRTDLEEIADRAMRAPGQSLERAPSAHSQLLVALDLALGPSHEVVIAGVPGADDTREMLRPLRAGFHPRAVVLLRPPGEAPEITALAEFARPLVPVDGAATAYVCTGFACEAPTTDPARMLEALRPDGEER